MTTVASKNLLELPFVGAYAKFQHQTAAAVNGAAGAAYGGVSAITNERVRPFNTELDNDIDGLSLDTTTNIGRFTFPAGTYFLLSYMQNYGTNYIRTLLRNATEDSIVFQGLTGFGRTSGDADPFTSILKGRFTLTAETQIEITQALDSVGSSSMGLGSGANGAENNVYADVEFWRLK